MGQSSLRAFSGLALSDRPLSSSKRGSARLFNITTSNKGSVGAVAVPSYADEEWVTVVKR
jgi:hypothetical protein